MKRLFTVLMCFLVFCCFTGCEYIKSNVVDPNFYCERIDENNVAIGNLKTYPKSGAVFFPEKIENYTVSKLGFNSGLGFGGNGYFHGSNQDGVIIKRCYFPHTIKEVMYGYMSLFGGYKTKLFYCGNVIDLLCLDNDRHVEIYVPIGEYDLFEEVLSKKNYSGSLLKANLSYRLNYGENHYYYIDYYENGEKILYIPPEPQRDGYSFGGWFKEFDCINEWDFATDILQFTEEVQDMKLYAKWIAAK